MSTKSFGANVGVNVLSRFWEQQILRFGAKALRIWREKVLTYASYIIVKWHTTEQLWHSQFSKAIYDDQHNFNKNLGKTL